MATPEQEGSAVGSPQTTPVPEEMDFDLFGPVQVLNLQLQVLSLGVLARQPKCLWVEVFLRLEHLFSFQSRLRPLWVRTNCSS